VYVSSYNFLLVGASLFVAILASYTALDMAGRITTAQGRAARWWLAGGASAMGIGIWSMHFIGMLAFSLPIPLGYDPGITFLSLLIANPAESGQVLLGRVHRRVHGVVREIKEERPGLLAFDERYRAIGQDVGQISARFDTNPAVVQRIDAVRRRFEI